MEVLTREGKNVRFSAVNCIGENQVTGFPTSLDLTTELDRSGESFLLGEQR